MENENAIAEFESQAPAIRSVGAEMAATREAQEVQVAMVVAQRFPRDPIAAYNRIKADCSRRSLAEKAMYEFTRGGTTVTGPSIHLAKALARAWGNLDSGFKVLESNPQESTVMAYCWDLETNYRESRIFTVPNIRQTKKGAYPLTDPRDIYENIANQSSRRERACILAVIPADVVDAAVGQCNATLAGDAKMPLPDMIRELVNHFNQRYDVTKEMLEAYIGRSVDAFTMQSVIRLKNVYNTLQDGTASVEQYFDTSAAEGKKKKEKKEKNIPQPDTPEPSEVPEPEAPQPEDKPVRNAQSVPPIQVALDDL